MLLFLLLQSSKAREQLTTDVSSLKARVEHLQKSKEDCEQSFRALKATLEEERHQYASTLNDVESSIVASIREKFSSQQIK